MKTELGRKVGDRILDRGTGPGLSVGFVPSEIFFEILKNLFELPQKILVLCKLFKTGLPRKLQHPHRVVVGLVPKLRIELPEQSAGRRFPRPPEIETPFPSPLNPRRQGRSKV